jgi:hypothetical protein
MPGSSNTSFIPKKTGVQHDRQTAVRQVYVGTLIVRILFVASLLAVAGVYGYQYKLKNDLDAQVVALNTAIASFNDAEMQRVVSVDKRLSQVSRIMAHTLSVSALLKTIEDSTTASVRITQLSVTRDGNDTVEIESELDTASFDSALFQKNILEKSERLSVIEITDLLFKNPDSDTESTQSMVEPAKEKTVSFKAKLAIAIDKIPHTKSSQSIDISSPDPLLVAPATAVDSPVKNLDVPVAGTVLGDSTENNQEEI